MIEQVQKLMESSDLSLFEKVQEHELLKHKQTMAGLLIHKAAQVVGADVETAIAPLNTVNFENRDQPKWMSSTISRSEVFNLPQMFNHRSTHDFLSPQRLQFYIF